VSWENVAIVRAAYSTYENGGVEALFPYFGPDIEWDMTKTGVADRTYTGPDGVREFFERLGQAWQEYTFRYDTFLHAGDEVLAIGGFRGRVAGSATEVEAPLVHIWTLQEGKGVRLRAYLDYSAALEAAAGLGYRGTPASVEVVRRGFDALARGDPGSSSRVLIPRWRCLKTIPSRTPGAIADTTGSRIGGVRSSTTGRTWR